MFAEPLVASDRFPKFQKTRQILDHDFLTVERKNVGLRPRRQQAAHSEQGRSNHLSQFLAREYDRAERPRCLFSSQLNHESRQPLRHSLRGHITETFLKRSPANFIRSGGSTCGTTLAAATTCTINVRFRPTTTGVLTGTLAVTSALAGSGVVALSGTGNGAAAAVSPATSSVAPYNFGSVTRGQVSAPLTVTVTNNGTTPMTFNAGNGLTLGGNTTQFRLTTGGSCVNGGTLPALGSCTFTVNFAPTPGTTRNTKNATVTIRSNATNGNQFVYVRGTAQ